MASPSYASRTYEIPAGGSLEIYRDATFIACLDAQASFKISFDGGPKTEFEAGLTYRPSSGLKLVELVNEGGSANSVTLAFGKGDISDSRLTLGNAITTKEEAPATFTTGAPIACPDGAATALAGVNSNRAEIVLANDGGGKIYVAGSAGAAAGEGLPVEAGATLFLTTTAALWARNDSGAAVLVAVSELERG